MRVTRPFALIIALLTVAPWGYFVFFVSRFMPNFTTMAGPDRPPDEFMRDFESIFQVHMLVMAVVAGLMLFYIVHLFRTDRVPSDKKTLWAIVLFMGNLIAMPIYWYLYVWPRKREGAA